MRKLAAFIAPAFVALLLASACGLGSDRLHFLSMHQ